MTEQRSKQRFFIGLVLGTVLVWLLLSFWLYMRFSTPSQDIVAFDRQVQWQLGQEIIELTVAETPAQLERGLGDWNGIDDSEGMLFELGKKEIPYFWMKNVEFPIDIIWLDGSVIVDISEQVPAQPGVPDDELTLYFPSQQVDRVIEVSAGFARKYGISVGNELVIDSKSNN